MPKDSRKKKGRKHENLGEHDGVHIPTAESVAEHTSQSWAKEIKVKSKFKLLPKHKEFFTQAIDDETKMIFVDGPAGTSKSYLAVYAALTLLQQGKIEKIYYIRSAVESASKSLGFLPGEADDKFAPYMAPLLEKMEELVTISDLKKLTTNKVVEASPVNYWRGRTASSAVVIIDEAQNMTKAELVTLLTRIGEGTRFFILGDALQEDIKNSGFSEISKRFDTDESEEHGIFRYQFGESEIVRSEILKFIVRQLGC